MEKLTVRTKSTPSPHCCAEKRKQPDFLSRALERCRSSLCRRRTTSSSTAPAGCFVVVVGPGKERFAVRAERANHPLFRALLEAAEAEYGFPRPAAGPLVLPCTAEEFRRVMAEVDREEDDEAAIMTCSAPPRSPPVVRRFCSIGAVRVTTRR